MNEQPYNYNRHIIQQRLTFVIAVCTAIISFVCFPEDSLAQGPLERLNEQTAIYPQEKIHMTTDRDVYCGGDTVWLRLFVVDAATHVPVNISKYAYVELIDPFGNVANRVKIIERNGIYSGYLPLHEDMPEGDYTIAAYTAFMENVGEEYFYKRQMHILTPCSSKYTIDADFEPSGEGRVKGHFKLRALRDAPMSYDKMKWEMPDGAELEMPDAKRGFSKTFRKDKNEDMVLVKFGDYSRYFSVPFPSNKTEVTFYPEGGYLTEGEMCRVAFKATDENGYGIYINGSVMDDTDEHVVDFSVSHNGMGVVSFTPEADRKYHAEYVNPDGTPGRAEIGKAERDAHVVRVAQTPTKVTFSAGGPAWDIALELLVACRGTGVLHVPLSAGSSLVMEKSKLPEGVCQAILYSPVDSAVLSERLFFIGADRKQQCDLRLTTDSLSFMALSHEGENVDCALRITNRRMTPTDITTNICTQLLLQSELRGRIEDPAQYFSGDRVAATNLDLVMLTNGWSRYDIPASLRGRYAEPEIPLEIGQEIPGQVRSRWRNKPLANVMVCAIAPKVGFATYADTDVNGEFHLEGFDFPEDTPFILQAMNEKGGLEGNFDAYPDKYPNVATISQRPFLIESSDISQYFTGSRWTMLDELTVQAYKPKETTIYEVLAAYSKTSKDFEKRGWTSLEEALRSLPGLINSGGYLMWRGAPVGYYIDGWLCESDTPSSSGGMSIQMYTSKIVGGNVYKPTSTPLPSDAPNTPSLNEVAARMPFQSIARIDFLRPEHAMLLGRHFKGGAILITTKDGTENDWVRQYELKDFLPLGYQEHKEYASPLLASDFNAYELETQPSVLWIPSIKLSELSDLRLKHKIGPDLEVRLEGVSPEGQIIFTDSRRH